MTDEKIRIPESDTVNSANSSREDISSIVQNVIKESLIKFATKEEYIKELLDKNEIKKADGEFGDSCIHLKGHLPIDNRVADGLNWNDVVVDSASVMDGKISQYKYLPLTRLGVKTNLSTENIAEFIKHNSFDAQEKDGKFFVGGIFRVPNIEKLPDLSTVVADKIFWYAKDKKIKLEDLPTAKNGFFGLASENIIANGNKVAKIAKEKGLGKNIRNDLAPSLFNKIFNTFKSDGNKN